MPCIIFSNSLYISMPRSSRAFMRRYSPNRRSLSGDALASSVRMSMSAGVPSLNSVHPSCLSATVSAAFSCRLPLSSNRPPLTAALSAASFSPATYRYMVCAPFGAVPVILNVVSCACAVADAARVAAARAILCIAFICLVFCLLCRRCRFPAPGVPGSRLPVAACVAQR